MNKPVKPTLKKKNDGSIKTSIDILDELELYKWEYPTYLKDRRQWETNNKQIDMRFKRHCSPAMETKLESMLENDGILLVQNGLGLIFLLKKVFFKQDWSKQKPVEIINVDKQLMLCWQQMGTPIVE